MVFSAYLRSADLCDQRGGEVAKQQVLLGHRQAQQPVQEPPAGTVATLHYRVMRGD